MDMGILMFPNPVATVPMAQMVESLGFDSFVFADTQCLTPEVWTHLMLVATATDRMEIGTGVTNPVSRDPAVTASAALAVQHASGGRVVVGIGRGDSSMAKIGRKPAPPSVFERYIEQLRAYLDGREVDRGGSPSRIEWLEDCEVPYVPLEVAATGPKVIDIGARHADRICFAVGADTERIEECMARARRTAEAADRDPKSIRFGAYINCLINDDREVAREAIRGSLSVFAHFSGFQGMDISSLPESVQGAASHLRTAYDMKNHAVSAGAHAQALDADFIHRFGIAGPVGEAIARLREIRDTGVDFLRIIPGSRDMPPGIGAESMQGVAKARAVLEDEAST